MSGQSELKTPDGYVQWGAEAKADWLWGQIMATAHTAASRPPLAPPPPRLLFRALQVLRRSGLRVTLERSDDALPVGRPKIIHTQGSMATIRLVINADSPYSGVLAPPSGSGSVQGVTVGAVRMSLATPSGPSRPVVPGMALKLFVAGQPSLDLLAVNHTNGQGLDPDLFSNSLTHDLTNTHGYLRNGQRLMSKLFHRVSLQPRRLSIDHFAAVSSDGVAVEANDRNRPQRLDFVPHPDVRGHFAMYPAGTDFRTVLGDLGAGTRLYDVQAIEASGASHLGVIELTSTFVSSSAGDRVFFRHVQADADLTPEFRTGSE